MDFTVTARQARQSFADVVERASRGEPTVITRRGREVAAVVPIDMLQGYRAWQERLIGALAAERVDEPVYPLEQVSAEILAEQRGSGEVDVL